MPETTELPTHIPTALMEEFLAASKGLKEAQGNMEKAQIAGISAQAVLEYVSKRIASTCQLGPKDTITEDGLITRADSAV